MANQQQNYLQKLKQIREKYGCSTTSSNVVLEEIQHNRNYISTINGLSQKDISKAEQQIYRRLDRIREIQRMRGNYAGGLSVRKNKQTDHKQNFKDYIQEEKNKQNLSSPKKHDYISQSKRLEQKDYGMQTFQNKKITENTVTDKKILKSYQSPSTKYKQISQIQINRIKSNMPIYKQFPFSSNPCKFVRPKVIETQIKQRQLFNYNNYITTKPIIRPELNFSKNQTVTTFNPKQINCLDNLNKIQQRIQFALAQKTY